MYRIKHRPCPTRPFPRRAPSVDGGCLDPGVLERLTKKTGKPGPEASWTCDCWDTSCSMRFSSLHESGIRTVMDRLEAQGAQCRVGQLGLCCRFCLQGPCRINPMGKEPTTGICGARDYTMVARFIDRMIAGGTASHAGHGKEIAHVLHSVARGKVVDYRVEDPAKLEAVAKKLGIHGDGKNLAALARSVSELALEDYSRYTEEPLAFLKATTTPGRFRKWDTHGVLPSNIETSIADVMHRTAMGVDAGPVPILFGGIKCSLSDYAGAQISSDLSEVLFGTPKLVLSEANLSVLDEKCINVAVHG